LPQKPDPFTTTEINNHAPLPLFLREKKRL